MQTVTGSDSLFLALDREMRAGGLRGNFTEGILELDGLPDPERIERRVNALAERFPIMRARLTRTWRRYEWIPGDRTRPCFHFHPYDPSVIDEGCPWNMVTKTHVDASDINPIEFHLIALERGSLLVLHAYHAAIDGVGTLYLLRYLIHEAEWDTAVQAEAETPPRSTRIVAGLSIGGHLAAIVKAARFFSRGGKSALPPLKAGACGGTLASRRLVYDADETSQMLSLAQTLASRSDAGDGSIKKAGRFVYFVAGAMRALQQAGLNDPHANLNIGYMTTLRPGRERHPLFGNQVAFLWTSAPSSVVSDKEALIAHLAKAHVNALSGGMEATIVAALDWARYLPAGMLGRIIRKGLGRVERHSFWFGYVGSMDNDMTEIEGVRIRGAFAVIPPTAPPSIVITYVVFQGQVSASVTYVPEHFEADWIDALVDRLDAELRVNGRSTDLGRSQDSAQGVSGLQGRA